MFITIINTHSNEFHFTINVREIKTSFVANLTTELISKYIEDLTNMALINMSADIGKTRIQVKDKIIISSKLNYGYAKVNHSVELDVNVNEFINSLLQCLMLANGILIK